MKILMKALILLFLLQLSIQRTNRVQKKIKSSLKTVRKQDIKTNVPETASESSNYSMPENLTDGNQDGYADEGDFIRSFSNIGLSPWELKQLFIMVDLNGNGQIDTNEWRNFHDMFISKFTLADKDKNLLLNEDELIKSFEDTPQLRQIIHDGTTMKLILNDISGRQDGKSPSLNFFEWMFVKRCSIGWGIANSRQITINKVELFDAALVIMLPFNQHDGQLKNQIYAALDFNQSQTEFTFIQMTNLFHKFMIFTSMIRHSSIHGTVSRNLLLKCIDDGIGPSEIFLIHDQSKPQTINQAFALLQDDEEIGLDFENFNLLMQIIYSVKQFGKTKPGTLNFDEFKESVMNHPVWKQAISYIKQSFVEDGNYQRGANFTLESEAYQLSQGKVQPVQNRFLQIPKNRFKHRLSKKRQIKFGRLDEKDEKDEIDNKKNFTLYNDPFIYFFNMFTSNSDDKLINYGDLYRIKKYHNLHSKWDKQFGPQVFLVYPETLTQEQITSIPVVLYLREKEIIREMIQLYKDQRQLDHVQVSLPLDLLGFCRFMAYDQLQVRVTKAKQGEEVAYSALYNIFQKMGMIPFNMDLNNWLRDIFQGQRGFKIYNSTEAILSEGRKVVDGHQQLLLASVRVSKQKQAQNQFQDSAAYMDPIIYSSPDRNDVNMINTLVKRRLNKK